MLEDHDRIDISYQLPDGSPVLVVTDSGFSTGAAWRAAFLKKLRAYGQYIASDAFEVEFPGKRDRASVEVMCAYAPANEVVDEFRSIALRWNGKSLNIPIRFRYMPSEFS